MQNLIDSALDRLEDAARRMEDRANAALAARREADDLASETLAAVCVGTRPTPAEIEERNEIIARMVSLRRCADEARYWRKADEARL